MPFLEATHEEIIPALNAVRSSENEALCSERVGAQLTGCIASAIGVDPAAVSLISSDMGWRVEAGGRRFVVDVVLAQKRYALVNLQESLWKLHHLSKALWPATSGQTSSETFEDLFGRQLDARAAELLLVTNVGDRRLAEFLEEKVKPQLFSVGWIDVHGNTNLTSEPGVYQPVDEIDFVCPGDPLDLAFVLRTKQVLVLQCLLRAWQGQTEYSQAQLVRELGWNRNTVYQVLRSLERLGVLAGRRPKVVLENPQLIERTLQVLGEYMPLTAPAEEESPEVDVVPVPAAGAPTTALVDTSEHYSKEGFWEKLSGGAIRAGQDVVKTALELYYAAIDSRTPAYIQTMIFGALGYFILPLDVIPDVMPVVGFTDDLGILSATAAMVATHIQESHVAEAARTLKKWWSSPRD